MKTAVKFLIPLFAIGCTPNKPTPTQKADSQFVEKTAQEKEKEEKVVKALLNMVYTAAMAAEAEYGKFPEDMEKIGLHVPKEYEEAQVAYMSDGKGFEAFVEYRGTIKKITESKVIETVN